MTEVREILELLNPWWKSNDINEELARPYKRKIFSNILKLRSYRQIVILSGLRRVGKTTLLYQMIEYLLKENDSKHILYFNLDKKVEELVEILDVYGELANLDWRKEKIFVFIDEIAKLDGWGRKVKLIYDAFPNIKFMVSSSSSIGLEEEAIKNLAGRYFLINVTPLSFVEFLELKGKKKYLRNSKLWQREIKREFNYYLLRSFPEIIDWEDELLIKDYLRTTIVDKIVKQDLPDKFKNVNRDLLLVLLQIFYSEPGMYLNYDNLSRKLRISKKTLIEHIYYLEFSYLLRRIRNFRISTLTTSRKMQRAYAYWWSLAYCYSDDNDKIRENFISSYLNINHYWRKNEKEIDFLVVNKKSIVPIEVKNKKKLTKNDLKNMKYFLEKYKISGGIVVYNGNEGKVRFNNRKIKLTSFWRYSLDKHEAKLR